MIVSMAGRSCFGMVKTCASLILNRPTSLSREITGETGNLSYNDATCSAGLSFYIFDTNFNQTIVQT
jgi:hypothetical protein